MESYILPLCVKPESGGCGLITSDDQQQQAQHQQPQQPQQTQHQQSQQQQNHQQPQQQQNPHQQPQSQQQTQHPQPQPQPNQHQQPQPQQNQHQPPPQQQQNPLQQPSQQQNQHQQAPPQALQPQQPQPQQAQVPPPQPQPPQQSQQPPPQQPPQQQSSTQPPQTPRDGGAIEKTEVPEIPVPRENVLSRSCGSQRNAAWAYRVYQEWASSRNSSLSGSPQAPVDLAQTTLAEIDFWLQRFVVEVRDKAGEPYRPATLYRLCCNFQRHLREVHGRWDVDLFRRKENTFAGFRQSLDNEMKRLAETPRWPTGVKSDSSMLPPPTMAPMSSLTPVKDLLEPSTLEDDATESARLWASFDLTTSTGLAHCMYFAISRIFGLRSREEHRRLEVTDFSFGVDERGHYVILRRRTSEPNSSHHQSTSDANSGVMDPQQSSAAPPQPTYQYLRHYANPNDPRDFVGLLRRYLSLVPSEGPFYRRPVYTPAGVPLRFSTQVVGVNTFSKWHKEMRERAGLDPWGRMSSHLRLNHNDGHADIDFNRKRGHRGTIRVSELFKSMSNNNGGYFNATDGDGEDEDVKIIIKKGERSIEIVL